jgi:hypothetical protein
MELTLAAALSAEGLVGHLAYVVLVLSMLMRRLLWLRLLVILSALLAIAYGAAILGDPVTVFWETLLVVVNIGQLLITHWRSLRARFSPDEQALIARHLPGLNRGEARALLDLGRWTDLTDGAPLTREGVPVAHLSYLAAGQAEVRVAGMRVSDCRAGDFVGEMTALTGLPATATVMACGPITVWQADAAALRAAVARHDSLAQALEVAFARSYRAKIVAMNRQAAGVTAQRAPVSA